MTLYLYICFRHKFYFGVRSGPTWSQIQSKNRLNIGLTPYFSNIALRAFDNRWPSFILIKLHLHLIILRLWFKYLIISLFRTTEFSTTQIRILRLLKGSVIWITPFNTLHPHIDHCHKWATYFQGISLPLYEIVILQKYWWHWLMSLHGQ